MVTAAAFVFQIARVYMVFDFHQDKLYITGIAVEFVLLIFTLIHFQCWTILAGFIGIRLCILFSVYIWIQCCANNSYTYLHEEEDIDNILKKFEDSSSSSDDDNTKTDDNFREIDFTKKQLNESKKTLAVTFTI